MGVGDIVSVDPRGIPCMHFLFRKSGSNNSQLRFLVSQVHTSERRICNIS